MDIGIRLHDTKPGTLRERLGYASAQGFTCVQLAMGKAIPDFRMAEAPRLLTEDLAAEVREELEKAGITCAVLGCYLKLSQAEEEETDRVREIYRAHLRFARWIGAGCVGTETPPVTCPEGEACRTEEQFRLFLERARPLARPGPDPRPGVPRPPSRPDAPPPSSPPPRRFGLRRGPHRDRPRARRRRRAGVAASAAPDSGSAALRRRYHASRARRSDASSRRDRAALRVRRREGADAFTDRRRVRDDRSQDSRRKSRPQAEHAPRRAEAHHPRRGRAAAAEERRARKKIRRKAEKGEGRFLCRWRMTWNRQRLRNA